MTSNRPWRRLIVESRLRCSSKCRASSWKATSARLLPPDERTFWRFALSWSCLRYLDALCSLYWYPPRIPCTDIEWSSVFQGLSLVNCFAAVAQLALCYWHVMIKDYLLVLFLLENLFLGESVRWTLSLNYCLVVLVQTVLNLSANFSHVN